MRDSGPSKGIVLSVLTALLAGAASHWAEGRIEEHENGSAIVVGQARVGDVVTYSFTARWKGETGETGEWVEQRDWRVRSIQPVADQTGRWHDAVVIDQSRSWDPEPLVQTSYIALADRHLVRHDDPPWDAQAEPIVKLYASALPGPRFWGSSPLHSYAWVTAAHQGLALSEGDAPDAITRVWQQWAADRGENVEHRAVVGEAALLGGKKVIPVRLELELEFSSEFLERETLTLWFAEGEPYPLRIEIDESEEWRRDDGSLARDEEVFIGTLVEVRQGDGPPIDWRSPLAPPPLERNAELERVATPYPASGADWPWYRIEDAKAHVESNPALVRFTAWQQQHPEARLVGATFNPGHARIDGVAFLQAMQDVEPWKLSYAEPGGTSAYIVYSQRDARGTILDRDAGELALPASSRYRTEDVPETFVSFAEIVRQWERLDPSAQGVQPSIVGWGIAATQDATAVAAGLDLRRAWLQKVDPNALGRTDVLYAVPANGPVAGIIMDMESGDVAFGWVATTRVNFARTLPLPAVQPEITRAPAAPAAPARLEATVGVLALLFALAAWFLPLLRYGSTSLYTRLTQRTVLDHALRDHIARIIREKPGVSAPQLQQELGAGWSTIVYHLGVLEKAGIATSVIDGRHRRFFLVGVAGRPQLRALALLQNKRTRHVLDLVRVRPGIDRNAIAAAIGVSAPGAFWHLKRLEAAGLVLAMRGAGRVVTYAPSPAAEELATAMA